METRARNVLMGALFIIVGFSLGYVLWGSSAPGLATHRMFDGSLMGPDIDQHFIVQMIPHHEGAIAMSNVALERSTRAEIRSLASDIIQAQERENRDMREWYESWFGSAPPAGGGMGMMHMGGMEGDVSRLQAVPASEFDREFLEQMIPHHEMAIVMAQMLQAGTRRPEMRQLASSIIDSQTREIELMRGLLQSL